MTDDELKALVASLANLREEFTIFQKDHTEQVRKINEKLEQLSLYLGSLTHDHNYVMDSQMDIAEQFFYNSLAKDARLDKFYFDDIAKNMGKCRDNLQEKYDLFMTNTDSIVIIEVKYKAHTNDLKKLDRKIENFKLLFPIYKDYKLYGALASFHINDDTKKEALERGYFVLQRSGDLIHTECPLSQLKIL